MNQLCITPSRTNSGQKWLLIVALCCGRGWTIHEWPDLSVADLVAQFLFIPTLQVCNALQPTTNSRQI